MNVDWAWTNDMMIVLKETRKEWDVIYGDDRYRDFVCITGGYLDYKVYISVYNMCTWVGTSLIKQGLHFISSSW